jgi:hypothetical protein
MVGDDQPAQVIVGGGGDGGPGIIQLHAPTLANIKAPTAPETFYKILKPPPSGTTLTNINLAPATNWSRLLPIFGPQSQALSKWIPLGAASVDPTSSTPDLVTYSFGGTVPATGLVKTDPSTTGAQALVEQLPPVATGTIAGSPTLPFIAADQRSVVFDAATLSDDIYTRNPQIAKQFGLELSNGSLTQTFEVGFASFDPVSNQFRVTVAESGTPLQPFGPGATAELIPRFFRVSTEGVVDSLPQSPAPGQPGLTIKVEFQCAKQTTTGQPDLTSLSAFETDIARLSNTTVYPTAVDFRFIRFRVTFNLLDGGGQLSFSTPIPSLEFFRIPFKF